MFLQEGVTSHDENMQYLNLAVGACAQRHTSLCHIELRQAHPVKRDSTGRIRGNRERAGDCLTFNVPFGPSLVPVRCQREDSPETGPMTPKELEVIRGRTCDSAPADRGPTVSTDDLLDCLLHPDVIGRVTELLLDRHAGRHATASPPP